MKAMRRQYLGTLFFHVSMLFMIATSQSYGDDVPKFDPADVDVKVWNGTEPCFTLRNEEILVDQTKVVISFKYDNFDVSDTKNNPSGVKCSCDRAPFSSRAGFRVFAHITRNYDSVRDTQSIIEGDLQNIPDIEKFNSAKIPRNKDYDVLPKPEIIEFPVQYINGRQASFYLVEVWCG